VPITKVYVGGPTQAGKSTLAKYISWATGLQAIELDQDRWITLARRSFNFKRRTPLQRLRAIQLLRQKRRTFVAEGIYLAPKDIAKILIGQTDVLALFIGYPKVSVADKKHVIQKNGYRDSFYLRLLSDGQLDNRLQDAIDISQRQQSACQNLGIPYFDFSDVERLGQNQTETAAWVQRRI